MIKETILVSGMTCNHCEMRITSVLKELKGVKKVNASFKDKTVEISYDEKLVGHDDFKKFIEEVGYKYNGVFKNKKTSFKDIVPIFIFFLALYFGVQIIFGFNIFNFIPTIDSKASLTMLFFVGLLTSVHCIGMCGSINLAVVMKDDQGIKSPLLYNLGRVISYTLIGGLVGFFGSLFSFNSNIQSIIILIASIVMLMMGLSMIGWLPRKLYFLIPRMPNKVRKHLNGNKGPFYVGLLNGFMPCGPLQAMQIYALGTGSAYLGALSMFLFALGTVPLMFGFGVLFVKLRGKYHLVIQRISSVLIILLSLFMFNRALNLMGIDVLKEVRASIYSDYAIATIKEDHQYVEITLDYNGYKPIMVQKDIPVIFNIKVSDIRYFGCTNTFKINELDLTVYLDTGDNLVKFTPTKVGTMSYTCWMGMVTSNIKVVEDLSDYE